MTQTTLLHIVKEVLWWLLAIVVATMLFFPFIGRLVIHHYAFALFAFLLMTWYLRLTIQFYDLPYLQPKAIRITLFFLNIGLIGFLIYTLNTFIELFDNRDIGFFWQDDNQARAPEMYDTFAYFKNMFFLSTVGAVITTFALEVRLAGYFLGWKRTKIKDRVVYKDDNS